MVGRLFSFAIGIVSYSFCRAFDGTSFKNKFNILSFSQVEIYGKEKNLPNIFNMTAMYVVRFEHEKNHWIGQKEINHKVFYRAFHGASSGKKFKLLSFT